MHFAGACDKRAPLDRDNEESFDCAWLDHSVAMSNFGDSEPFGGWDDALPVYADDVVRRWWGILASEKPWADMPRDDSVGHMRRVLNELLNEARDPDQEARQLNMVAAAHEHGSFRRAQRCRAEDLVCEFGLIIDALDGALQSTGMPSNLIGDALRVLDADVSLAQEAATRGWYCARPERPFAADTWFNRFFGELD